jgi:hypothetical protein
MSDRRFRALARSRSRVLDRLWSSDLTRHLALSVRRHSHRCPINQRTMRAPNTATSSTITANAAKRTTLYQTPMVALGDPSVN